MILASWRRLLSPANLGPCGAVNELEAISVARSGLEGAEGRTASRRGLSCWSSLRDWAAAASPSQVSTPSAKKWAAAVSSSRAEVDVAAGGRRGGAGGSARLRARAAATRPRLAAAKACLRARPAR